MIFTMADYRRLHRLFDLPGYAGYKPAVSEVPNGDGVVDVGKKWLHVALKYDPPEWAVTYLARAHFEACRIAEAVGCPAEYYPKVQDGTLRVLEYPQGAGSAPHTDFDLFTVSCYRNFPDRFVRLSEVDARAERIDPHVHIGELGELVGLGGATRHQVLPTRSGKQYSIVYFAMPDHNALLPSGRSKPCRDAICHDRGEQYECPFEPRQTVGEWLKERYARSRVPA